MCKKSSPEYPQFQSAANSELNIAHCSSGEGTDESHQLNVTKKDSECFKHYSAIPVMPHFESILKSCIVHQDQTQTKTPAKLERKSSKGRDEKHIGISFKNIQKLQPNATTSLKILQKRQQLFRQYAATQRKETLVLSNSNSEKIDADLLHIVSQNNSACEPWVKELNLFQKDMNILRSKKNGMT